MSEDQDTARDQYPHGRGYGHDYMRGGEVLGGYGYADREEYAARRGELHRNDISDATADQGSGQDRSP
jgi:hypothetical protein